MKFLQQSKFVETKQNCCFQGLQGWYAWGLLFNGCRVSGFQDEKTMEIDDGDGCTTL